MAETVTAKYIIDTLFSEKNQGFKYLVAMRLLYENQSSCYITAVSDILAKELLLPRNKVIDAVKKDAVLRTKLIDLRVEVYNAIMNIEKNKGGIYDIIGLLAGDQITRTMETIDESGAKIKTTKTKKFNPLMAQRFLRHGILNETGVNVFETDMSDEDVIPILREEKREVTIIPKVVQKNIVDNFDKQQLKALDAVLSRNDRIVSLGGAVRCGKTWLATYASIMYILWHYCTSLEEKKKEYNCEHEERKIGQIVFIGKTAPACYQNVFKGCMELMKVKNLPASRSFLWQILNYNIRIIGCGKLALESLKGITADHIHVDEAENLCEDSYNMLISRLSNPWSKMFLVHNPKTPSHWLSKYIQEGEAEKRGINHFNFSLLDCEFVDKKYVQMLISNYGENSPHYKRFVLGRPASVSGVVYTQFKEDEHIIPIVENLEKYEEIHIGYDHGHSSPRVYCAIGLYQDLGVWKIDVIDELAYEHGHNETNTLKSYTLDLIQFTNRFNNSKKLKKIYVPHDATDQFHILKDQGYPVCFATRKITVMQAIGTIQQLFSENRIRISSNCKSLINDLFMYEFKQDVPHDEISKQNDHSIDALRYAITSCGVQWKKVENITTEDMFSL